MVMYAGKVAEVASVTEIFKRPKHPYTVGLINSKPDMTTTAKRLRHPRQRAPTSTIGPAAVPSIPRCEHAMECCAKEFPPTFTVGEGHEVACWLYEKESEKHE